MTVVFSLASVEAATADTRSFTHTIRHGQTLVFKLKAVHANQIRAAFLKTKNARYKLNLHRVRVAARRGVLRVHLPRALKRHHRQRNRARSSSVGDPTLVIVTAGTTAASTLTPTADAYVSATRKNQNYGGASDLRADGAPIARSYLRFEIQGLAAPVSRALLKVYGTTSSSLGLDVRPVPNAGWDERKITYSNAPVAGGVAASSGAFGSGKWVSIDVTSLVKGNGTLSVALSTLSDSEIALPSRETHVNVPELAIETVNAVPADVSAPSPPTSLQASAAQTSLLLSWTASVDDVGVIGYGLYIDGASAGTTAATSSSFPGLACGTSYDLAVDAYDAAGNHSAKTSLRATTLACSGSIPAYAVRGMYDRDSSATGFDYEAAIGFNFIDTGPYKALADALAARGLKGFVWLGGYSNTTCTFNQGDDWIRSHVSALAGNPGVGAYFIDDEPNAVTCPNAPSQIKARSDLVKSIDPGPPTFMVDYKVDQFKLWAGKTDILGLDHYPCSIQNGCDYTKIDAQAAEADRLGIRYWGILQAFGDGWYKVPTAEELHQQFVHWRATQMEGYLVFAWEWPSVDPTLWLANNSALQDQLAVENAL